MLVFSSYPSDVRVRREAETLQQSGAQVDLICYRKKNQKAKEQVHGVNVYRINVDRKRSIKFRYICEYASFIISSFFKLNRLCLKNRYHVVHVHNMPEILVFSALIPRLFGAKIILDLHDPTPEVYMAKYNIQSNHLVIKVLALLEKLSIKFAHFIITPNKAFRDRFIERGCPPDKIDIVMNTPKDETFKIQTQNNPDKIARQQNVFNIMYHGTIVERHGLEIALIALTLLRSKIPNLEFNVYGDGEYVGQFKKIAQDLNLDNIVNYYGFVTNEEIAKAILSIDVGIIPNLKNPFTEINLPVRIFEYLCHEKPVIVPKTTGILDYFDEDSINFFKAGDAKSLADAIYKIYKDPLGQNKALEKGIRIYNQYLWKHQGAHFIDRVKRLTNPFPMAIRKPLRREPELNATFQLLEKNSRFQ